MIDFTSRRGPTSPAAHAALVAVADHAQSRLVALLGEALGQVDDTLFDFLQGGSAAHGRHQQYFDAMRELRLKRESVLALYAEHFRTGSLALERGEPRTVPRLVESDGDRELQLVAEDELEEQLAIDMLAQTLRRRLGRALPALDRRLAAAVGLATIEPAQNPFGAHYVAFALSAALRECEIGIQVKLVLFKLYERALAGRIDTLCLELNQRLIDAGVLPTLATDNLASPVAPALGALGAPAVAAQLTQMQAEVGRQRGETAATRRDAQDDLLYETLSELLQAYREQKSRAAAADASAQTVPIAMHSGMPAASPAAGSAVAAVAARALSSREMLSILSLLQAQPPENVQAAITDSAQSVAGLLKHELLKNAERLGLNPGEARVDPTDEDAIDLVGMLFDVLLDERDLQADARSLLGRLLVPYVKVALLDRRMFLRKSHPARRLLNALAEGLAVMGHEQPERDREMLDQVERAVDRLVEEFNEDIAIFEAVEQDFNEFIERHRRRIALAEKRAAEAQQGRERLDRARARAQADFEALLIGREPPAVVRTLLGNAWLQHLTLVVLRSGIGAPAYREALDIGERVLELAADWPPPGPARIEAQAVLESAIAGMLATVGGDAEAAHVQADAVAAALSGTAVEEAAARTLTMRLTEPVAEPARELDAPIAGEAAEYTRDEVERLRALTVGTWIDLCDADGEMKPAKLSWISPISGKRLFVNRRGLRVCVVSLDELAALLHSGQLIVREGESPFEQAMHQVLGRLGAVVGRPAPPGRAAPAESHIPP